MLNWVLVWIQGWVIIFLKRKTYILFFCQNSSSTQTAFMKFDKFGPLCCISNTNFNPSFYPSELKWLFLLALPLGFSPAFYACSIPPVGPNKFTELGQSKFNSVVPVPTAQKWSIAGDHTLVYTPSRKNNHQSQHLSFTVKFACPFSFSFNSYSAIF